MPAASTWPGGRLATSGPARGGFATTHWSMVVRAGQANRDGGHAELEELCRLYWFPLYCFARRRTARPQDAEDLTQGFFAELLSRDGLARADANRGRFRTFLLSSFRNFCSHERARAGARKRGGDCLIVSTEALQEAGARLENSSATTESPEREFDRRWASGLLDRAMAIVRSEYAALGKAALFEELNDGLLRGRPEGGYEAIAQRLGTTPGALRIAAVRLRQRLGREIRAEAAMTVAREEDLEDELRHLMQAVE